MTKENIKICAVLGGWVVALLLFIEFKVKSAAYIMPIFTVIVLIYLATLTLGLLGKKEDKKKDNQPPNE